MLVIWLTCYGKENNGNLKVLKPDSYYSLWLDHNNLSSSMCSGNLFCVSDNITWFSLPYFRYELLSLKKYMSILSKALVPKCTKSYYFILINISICISLYIKYIAYVREYSLPKTYTLLLKFPRKEKIFQKKKHNIL